MSKTGHPGDDPLVMAAAARHITRSKMERFAEGDDSARPDAYDNLATSRDEAKLRAERYLRWIKMCDELIATGAS